MKTSDSLSLKRPPQQNKSTGSCSEGSNRQKNCKTNKLKKKKKSKADGQGNKRLVDPSTNHIQPINAPIITTANTSTLVPNHRRQCKWKTTTNRYWRCDNHNIQLDSNTVINLSNVTALTQLLARGFSFNPTPRHIDWSEIRADFYELSRHM